MEKKLTADLNVVANSNLEIEYLNGDLNIIQKLDDEPNDVGGLTSAQLKAKFDEAGNTIKTYINDTLIPAILTDDATEAAREAAEQERVTAEQGRVSAEEARVTAETARDSAESERRNAESSRVTAEGGRASAEASRVEAEAQRAAAEQARADENTGIVARATAQANAAAGSAESASASAQTAQSAAGSAGTAASTASSAAAAASGSASDAAGSAAAAAQSAASAAGKAFVITGTVTDDEETGGYTVSGVTVTEAEIQAAIAAGKAVVAKLTYNNEIYELPLVYHDDQSQYQFGGNLGGLLLFFSISYTESGIGFSFSQIMSASADSLMGLSTTVDNQNQILLTHVNDTIRHVTAGDKTAWNAKAEKPKAVPVKIQAGGWNSSTKKQTVPVSGVSADTTSQVVWVTFQSETALDAYMNAGIVPVAQGANSVTFRADTIPTETIPVIVVIQPVTFMA